MTSLGNREGAVMYRIIFNIPGKPVFALKSVRLSPLSLIAFPSPFRPSPFLQSSALCVNDMKDFTEKFWLESFKRDDQDQILMIGKFINDPNTIEVSIYDLLPRGKYDAGIDFKGIRPPPNTPPEYVLEFLEFLARYARALLQILESENPQQAGALEMVIRKQYQIYALPNMGRDPTTKMDLEWGTIEPQSQVYVKTEGDWGTVESQDVLGDGYEDWMRNMSDFNRWKKCMSVSSAILRVIWLKI
ncbi:hypothetical protein CSUB01_05968 [Colletotrichum sublineola]|uniref:Uncharacterized protein n=1 Tax=Colletotrichum sublineola TaxID=1173701 RepID=A0A066X4V8_COLSU|nr:hypothetical protein CSUB01_05968 [Colletotrichum sublineola]